MFLTFFAIESSAFKVETHIWIAQQVINDLARHTNGLISFQIGDRTIHVPVPEKVRDAILQNPEAYRMGNVGPDAFPGIFEGQMTIHPGAEGWGTGEWLEHVLRSARNDEELAFAYGMIGHAAADVWAHSYVNHYAGDEFLLKDHETVVEARHFILESYIASHMPPLSTVDNRPLGPVYDLIKKGGRYAIPEDFLFKVFVEDAEAAKQFKKSGSVHIAAVHTLNKNLLHLARNEGPTDQLHRLIQQILIASLTEYTASTEELRMLNKAHQKLLDVSNGAIDDLQKAHDEYRALVRNSLVKSSHKVENALKVADEEIALIDDSLGDLLKERNRIEAKIESILKKLDKLDKLHPDPGSRKLKKELNKKRKKLQTSIRALESSALKEAENARKRFRENVTEAHKALVALYDAETKLRNDLTDLAQSFKANENPIKNTLLEWVDGNKKAMKAYFIANAEAIENSMRGRSMSAPLTNWAKCEALTFIGVPRDGLHAGCSIIDAKDQIMKLLEIAKKFDPFSAKVVELRSQIETNLLDFAKDEALDYGEAIFNLDMSTLLEALKEKPTRANLDRQFLETHPNKSLIKIREMSSRVDSDMALDTSGHFDPKEFAAIYNALVLVRLSLLDAESLNTVAGTNAYASTDLTSDNIMTRFTRSIDGDYQWMNPVPPYARAQGEHAKHGPYGYDGGFPLWSDSTTRTNVFRMLFKGPLHIGGIHALPSVHNYPYEASEKSPFPDYPDDSPDK
jgi:hypothetical protein